MRQLAVFESTEQARTLAAYLVAQRIAAHAEQESNGYSVWVRDEDQLPAAKEALAHFRENPSDARYANVELVANDVRRQQEAEHAARQKNVVEMRGRWKSGPGVKRKAPLTIGLIVVSVLVALGTNFAQDRKSGGLLDHLAVVDFESLVASFRAGQPDYFAAILSGEVWRIVTPIFIHFGMAHLIFNLWWMFVEGGQMEDRLGSRWYALFVIFVAVTSVGASALFHQWQQDLALAGGMSGVVYGVFGFLWMKVKFDPADGYQLDRVTVTIAMAWLVICILRDFPPFEQFLGALLKSRIDNVGHLVGLAMGMAIGYGSVVLKRR